MNQSLCISVTFLDPMYHGRNDGGRAGEWPPSPMRLFQALTAAAFGGCAVRADAEAFRAALHWLERREPPEIVAAVARQGTPCTLFVPNNDGDIIARAWEAGKAPPKDFSELKTAKVMRPHHLDQPAQVHFVWGLEQDTGPGDAAMLCRLARRVVALGWGTDLVACDGRIVDPSGVRHLSGERWKCILGTGRAGDTRRVPVVRSLDDLERRHAAFLYAMEGGVYAKPPPLTTYHEVVYRRVSSAPMRPCTAFALRPVDPDVRTPWRAFRQERAVCVAAMLRHAAWEATKADLGDWRDDTWAEQFVAGHGPRKDNGRFVDENWPRFSYLPLPTIDPRGVVSMIRRVLIAEPLPQLGGDGRSAAWAATRLGGVTLHDEETGREAALLDLLPDRDTVLARYLAQDNPAQDWVSVTPVILPGFDDAKPAKRERLLRECLDHAGYDTQAVASLEPRPAPWLAGCPPTQTFQRPRYLRHLPALHVRIRFRSPTAGPVALGAGRHCGLGVFAAL